MLYDSSNCSNSTYWTNFSMVGVGFGLLAFVSFVAIIVLLILYFAKRNKDAKLAKKYLTALKITAICFVILLCIAIGIKFYISSQTKDLGYCWGVK